MYLPGPEQVGSEAEAHLSAFHGSVDLRIAGVLQRIAICYFASALVYLHLNARKIVWLSAGILLGYWAVMALVPVPGAGAGVYLPDLNLANWLDLHYLPGRMYQGTWDNEGILSTFPAVVTCLLGVLAGTWLRSPHTETRKVRGLLLSGIGALAAGWIWHLAFPVNKLLWTSRTSSSPGAGASCSSRSSTGCWT